MSVGFTLNLPLESPSDFSVHFEGSQDGDALTVEEAAVIANLEIATQLRHLTVKIEEIQKSIRDR
jgi:hypothetical protein